MIGGPGRDKLKGGPGNDRLRGGRDNDQLYPGEGDDRLTGGLGTDRVIISADADFTVSDVQVVGLGIHRASDEGRPTAVTHTPNLRQDRSLRPRKTPVTVCKFGDWAAVGDNADPIRTGAGTRNLRSLDLEDRIHLH